MEPIYLFNLISQHKSWLSTRQALVSQNVANASTPGYQARDVMPFSKVLERSGVEAAATHPMHLRTSVSDARAPSAKPDSPWETSMSGNSVSLEQELMKAGEIRGQFSLDSSVMKAFQGMWLSTMKGGT